MQVRLLPGAALVVLSLASAVRAQAPGNAAAPSVPATFGEFVAEVVERNPDLAALRARHDASRVKPDIERPLMPPMVEAQVFSWPFDTVNPSNAQFMFTLQQELPGRGKRQVRTALAEKEASAIAASVEVRSRGLVDEVKRAWADLLLARQALEVYDSTWSCCGRPRTSRRRCTEPAA